DIAHRYMAMEPLAAKILDLKKELETSEAQLQAMCSGLLHAEQQYIVATHYFNHQLKVLDSVVLTTVDDIYDIRNSRFQRDFFQQSIKLLEAHAKKRLPIMEDGDESSNIIQTKEAIAREVKNIVSSMLTGRSSITPISLPTPTRPTSDPVPVALGTQ